MGLRSLITTLTVPFFPGRGSFSLGIDWERDRGGEPLEGGADGGRADRRPPARGAQLVGDGALRARDGRDGNNALL